MEYRDSVKRIHRITGGEKEWYIIRRLSCPDDSCPCKLHRELPDALIPFKHYDSGLIEDVIDETVSCEDKAVEDHPCEDTMKLWRLWWSYNRERAEGQMRSAAYSFLGFGYEFLKSTDSLLEKLRERIYRGWLMTVLRFIYNTGGRLEPEAAPG